MIELKMETDDGLLALMGLGRSVMSLFRIRLMRRID